MMQNLSLLYINMILGGLWVALVYALVYVLNFSVKVFDCDERSPEYPTLTHRLGIGSVALMIVIMGLSGAITYRYVYLDPTAEAEK